MNKKKVPLLDKLSAADAERGFGEQSVPLCENNVPVSLGRGSPALGHRGWLAKLGLNPFHELVSRPLLTSTHNACKCGHTLAC